MNRQFEIGMLVDLLFEIRCPNGIVPKGTTVRIVNILEDYYIVTIYNDCFFPFVVQDGDIRLSLLES